MPTKFSNRREDERFEIPRALGATIGFAGPDGHRFTVALIGVSAQGASFTMEMPRRLHRIETGTMLNDAVIRIAGSEIAGNLSVSHTTRGFHSDYSCGVQFFPTSEADRNELMTLVSRLRKLARR